MDTIDESGNNLVKLEFSLEKHNFDEHINQQRTYQEGKDAFQNKYYDLPNSLLLNLQHEAGLAEMYKSKRELLKYSIHIYRQIELVFEKIFGAEMSKNESIINHSLTKIYKRIKWEKYPCKKLYPQYSNFHIKLKENLEQFMQTGKNPHLTISQKEFLFKNTFYFSGHYDELINFSKEINSNQKVYLNAFGAIKYFRNLASHNNLDNQPMEKPKGDVSEHKYYENPEIVVDSNYFQQYVNMVLLTYINHLKNPYY